jgi:hypothetical protein
VPDKLARYREISDPLRWSCKGTEEYRISETRAEKWSLKRKEECVVSIATASWIVSGLQL